MSKKDEIRGSGLKMLAQVLLLPVFMLGYIGAQTGSLIIQAVIAASVGIAVAVKLYWSRIVKLFNRGKSSKGVTAEAAATKNAQMETAADGDTSEESLLPDAEMNEPESPGTGSVASGGETGVEE